MENSELVNTNSKIKRAANKVKTALVFNKRKWGQIPSNKLALSFYSSTTKFMEDKKENGVDFGMSAKDSKGPLLKRQVVDSFHEIPGYKRREDIENYFTERRRSCHCNDCGGKATKDKIIFNVKQPFELLYEDSNVIKAEKLFNIPSGYENLACNDINYRR